MKKFATAALILGAILLIAGFVVPYVQVQQRLDEGVSLIGVNANQSLYTLYLKYPLPIFLLSYGGAILLTGIICLAFGNAVSSYCKVRSTLTMLLMSLILGIDVTVGMIDSTIVNLIGNLVTVFIFMFLFSSYTKQRKENKSFKGTIIDIALGSIYLYPFAFTVQEIMTLFIK